MPALNQPFRQDANRIEVGLHKLECLLCGLVV
jgi:hypothetical protein